MFGKKLIDIRELNNLKQYEMANILGVSRGHYSMWEIDKETIPLKRLNILCNYFNISMDYIVGFTKEKNSNGIHELDNKIIGNRIKLIRKKYNISQISLAQSLNTNRETIYRYETGKRLILTDFAYEICKEYKVSLDWLCGRV